MLNGEPIGYAQSYVALGSGEYGGRRNRSRSTRNRPVTGECITTGQRLGKTGSSSGLSCCSMIPRSPDPNDPSPSNLRAIRCYEKAGFERARYRNHPRWSSRVHGSNTPGIRANTQCCLTLPSRTSKGWRPGRPSCQTLNIMREAVIAEVSTQLSEVAGVIERHLELTLLAVHFRTVCSDGGLKPHSDIDLLVTVTVRL